MTSTLPTHRLVHLTDAHLTAESRLLHDRLEPWSRLFSALSAAAQFRPDAVVISGDLGERGHKIHDRAAPLLTQAEAQLGCPVITVPGNHDTPGAIGERFNTSRTASGPHSADTVHEITGLRVIGLDSHGFEQPQGWLDPEQLDWLTEVLATPVEHGTVLLLHHPPIPTIDPFLSTVGLANAEELSERLHGTDVRVMLSGHLHLSTSGVLGAIPVWSGPALAYNHNPFTPAGTLQGLDSSWLSVVDVHAHTVATSAVPMQTASAVFTRHLSPSPSPSTPFTSDHPATVQE
ncbi:metallophosphoesterase family protein [Citricoccus muralis]|uniref:Metallophosphoesterase n=1 Tax=Citricoccus muralis TaxID=169134 RepID=A0ABY8H416_9MICC|nr:metallophosphoesterase [Citricoccus muralis]WFP15874.1 metallophosphoesterase [Citricoccus muralis]